MSAVALPISSFGSFAAGSGFELASHRTAMLRFARRKIRDENLAEDAVQDALVAAMSSRQSFQGRSALRTWLIGILNHKIQDVFRRESRYVRPSAEVDGETVMPEPGALEAAAAIDEGQRHDPVAALARQRMHDELIKQVEQLPDSLREVFMLQVVEGLPTTEVCARLGITEANCWVRLHRARKRLAERMRDHRD